MFLIKFSSIFYIHIFFFLLYMILFFCINCCVSCSCCYGCSYSFPSSIAYILYTFAISWCLRVANIYKKKKKKCSKKFVKILEIVCCENKNATKLQEICLDFGFEPFSYFPVLWVFNVFFFFLPFHVKIVYLFFIIFYFFNHFFSIFHLLSKFFALFGWSNAGMRKFASIQNKKK